MPSALRAPAPLTSGVRQSQIQHMSTSKPASALESIAGHVATQVGLSYVPALLLSAPSTEALSATLLAPLLAPLAQALASGRQIKRVEEAMASTEALLQKHSEALKNITDEQYKVINEAILSIYSATNDEKIEYLKRAIQNALSMSDIQAHESVALGRLLRDLSAEEARFLISNFSAEYIILTKQPSQTAGSSVLVNYMSPEGIVVNGLLSLGLVAPSILKFMEEEQSTLEFTPLVAKLIALLRSP